MDYVRCMLGSNRESSKASAPGHLPRPRRHPDNDNPLVCRVLEGECPLVNRGNREQQGYKIRPASGCLVELIIL